MPKQTQPSTSHVSDDELYRSFRMGTCLTLLVIAVFALVMGVTGSIWG